jgi:putative acetyltransferase
MGPVTVRPVRLSDAPALHRIQLQDAVLPYILPVPSLRLEALEERIRHLEPDHHYLVAERDGTVVGYAGLRQYRGRQAHSGLVYLAVDANYHRQGIGTALLDALVALADRWLRLERLELTVLAINPHARRLYERFGFVAEGLKRGAVIVDGQFVDELLMARYRPGGELAGRALSPEPQDPV